MQRQTRACVCAVSVYLLCSSIRVDVRSRPPATDTNIVVYIYSYKIDIYYTRHRQEAADQPIIGKQRRVCDEGDARTKQLFAKYNAEKQLLQTGKRLCAL